MKKLTLTIFALMFSLTTSANWSSIFSSTNLIGCGAGAAGVYMINMNNGQSLNEMSQGLVTGCILAGVVTHFFDQSMAAKYAVKEREDRKKLMGVIQEYRYQDASTLDVNGDVSNRYQIRKEIVPAKTHPDGSITLESLRLKIDKAGSGLLLGE